MTNPECSVTVTVYRVRHGDGAMFYGVRFEYLGSRTYPRRIMELMEPVPFDEAVRRYQGQSATLGSESGGRGGGPED